MGDSKGCTVRKHSQCSEASVCTEANLINTGYTKIKLQQFWLYVKWIPESICHRNQ